MAVSMDFMNKETSFDFKSPSIFHDRVLLVGEEKFYVVSGTLSFWSEYFRGLFSDHFGESEKKEVELKEIDPAEFEVFLQVLYRNGSSNLTAKHLMFLIDLSYRFLAPNILAICKDFIDKNPNQLTLELLDKVCSYGNEDLKENLIVVIQDTFYNFDTVELVEIAVKQNLHNFKDWICDNLYNLLFPSNCSDLMDCASNFNLQDLKKNIIADISAWPDIHYLLDDDVIIDLVKCAFKHDVAILKKILRERIFYMVEDTGKISEDNLKITRNWFFEMYHEDIFALPDEMKEFVIMSTIRPE